MPLKVKIVSAGSIGNHLAQASRRMGWEVTVVDIDPVALRRMREEIYPTRYGAWDEAITLTTSDREPRGGFEIIMIGTPPDVRMPLALRALEEKPKILQLEKPLSTPALEGLDAFLAAYRAQTGTVAIVGYDHGVSESVEEVLRMLGNRAVGEVETIDVEFREHWQGIFRAHPWLKGPEDTYLGYSSRGGGAACEHSHALHLFSIFAERAGLGSWKRVTNVMEMRREGRAEFDAVAAFGIFTESGRVGRVVQDVITWPVKKWVRIQGTNGFIEWMGSGNPEGDVVRFSVAGGAPEERVFKKKRPDDFYRETLHMQALLEGTITPADSPISLERGVRVMRSVAACHANRNGMVTL